MCNYTGFNMLEVNQLDLYDYLMYRRDAVIYEYSQSEKGLEYLENAKRLEIKEPDREQLREQFGKEE